MFPKRLDPEAPPDVGQVLEASSLLDITEFELFRLAFVHWFGHRPEERRLERAFAVYMFRQVAPLWVRDFARRVVEAAAAGPLDRAAFGVSPRAGSARMVSRGLRFAVALIVTLAVLVLGAELAALTLGVGGRCLFPPCY